MHSDVALGSLALHRNKMEETSSLKVREYLAYGLPVILAGRDSDFRTEVPFILRLPNCEGSLTPYVELVRSFGASWIGRRVPRPDVAHIGVGAKESGRLAFLSAAARLRS